MSAEVQGEEFVRGNEHLARLLEDPAVAAEVEEADEKAREDSTFTEPERTPSPTRTCGNHG
jgi:hypothetical protein